MDKERGGAQQIAELRWDAFEALNGSAIYELLALRQVVFVVEQACAYLDADGLDLKAWHLRAFAGAPPRLVGCLRVLPPSVGMPQLRIGRVVTHPTARGRGLGHRLMREALAWIEAQHGRGAPIVISAQAHLRGYYHAHGFRVTGAPYDEDGIPHLRMERACTAASE